MTTVPHDLPRTRGAAASSPAGALVFDLGGVVLTWEPEAIVAAVFDDPAVRARVHAQILGHDDWIALDRGTLALEDAIARAARRTGLSPEEVAAFFQAVPPALSPREEMLDLLRRLQSRGHRLFCLSNMHRASLEHLERAHRFWEVFEGRVISCRVQMVKPEPGIYRHLLETHSLRAAATLFVDDVEINVRAAEVVGMRGIRFESRGQCEAELGRLGYL